MASRGGFRAYSNAPFYRDNANEVKRDSGIAPSYSTNTLNQVSQPATTSNPRAGTFFATSPIDLQDAPSQSAARNKVFLFPQRATRESIPQEQPEEKEQEFVQEQKVLLPPQRPGPRPLGLHTRLRSFHGIDLDLGSDIGFDDLTSPDKLHFTNRGSLLFGGKVMDRMIKGTGMASPGNSPMKSLSEEKDGNGSADSPTTPTASWREPLHQRETAQMTPTTPTASWREPLRQRETAQTTPTASWRAPLAPQETAQTTPRASWRAPLGQQETAQTNGHVHYTFPAPAVVPIAEEPSRGLELGNGNIDGDVTPPRRNRPRPASMILLGSTTDMSNVSTPSATTTPTTRGLRSGPRTPSVHMLQSVVNGTRVMSAEEVSFSEKVRSMYDAGDENAADWSHPMSNTTGFGSPPPQPRFVRDQATPEPQGSSFVTLDNPRRRPLDNGLAHPALRSPGSRLSYVARDPYASAGGAEDWKDVEPPDVDRYGFISQAPRFTSGRSTPMAQRPGLPRVSTSLQVLSSNPRPPRNRILRVLSNNHASQSLPPSRSVSRLTTHTVDSTYSTASHTSASRSANPFRSRDRRLLDEAGDMLTSPPGLSHISEDSPTTPASRARETAREQKWHKMARVVSRGTNGSGMTFSFNTSDPKLVARTWKGIPDSWRATAWHSFLLSSAKRRDLTTSDESLIKQFLQYQDLSCPDDVQIDLDVPRTINSHIMFRRRYRGGQRLLFRVLHAIALHFPLVGYVQGMAALAATLLCYYDEERAFVMLVRLWTLRGLEKLFAPGFEGLMSALEEFNHGWLDADVRAHLSNLGIEGTSYGTRWYLTLFNMSIPFPAQLRVWDVFMLLGDADASSTRKIAGGFGGADLSVLHAASAALVDATRQVLLEADFENAMKTITSWIPVRDEDLLMRVAGAEWKLRKGSGRR